MHDSKILPVFTIYFMSLSKIRHNNMITQTLENYIVHPARNPSLLISGSVITMTSLSQWNLFDIKYITGGNVEYMMLVNTLSVLQFVLGWRSKAKKPKSEIKELNSKIDSKILALQSEVNHLKSELMYH